MRAWPLLLCSVLLACGDSGSRSEETPTLGERPQRFIPDSGIVRAAKVVDEQGRAFVKRGLMDSAHIMFDSSIAMLEGARDTIGLGRLWFQKQRAFQRANNPRSAITAGIRCIAYRKRIPGDTTRALAKATGNTAFVYGDMGLLDSALLLCSLTDSILKAQNAPAFEVALLRNSTAMVQQQLNDHGRALHLLEQAHAVFEDRRTVFPPAYDGQHLRAINEANLALSLSDLDRHDEAIAHAEHGLLLIDSCLLAASGQFRTDLLETRGKLYEQMVDPYARSGDQQGSSRVALNCLRTRATLYPLHAPELLAARTNWAIALHASGHAQEAMVQIDSVLAMYEAHLDDLELIETGYRAQFPMSYALKALICAGIGDTSKAIRSSDQALAMAGCSGISDTGKRAQEGPGSPLEHAKVWDARASMFRILYDSTGKFSHLLRSIAAYDECLGSLEELVTSTDITNRSTIAGTLWPMFQSAVRANAEAFDKTRDPAYVDRMLKFIEASKRASLEKRRRHWVGGLPANERQLIERIESAERERSVALRELSDGKGTIPEAPLRTDTIEKMRSALEAMDLHTYRTLFSHQRLTLASIQERLEEGEVVAEFLQGLDHMDVLWFSKDTAFILRPALSVDSLRDAQTGLSEALVAGSIQAQKGATIYATVFRDAINLLRPTHLTVVPDGLMWNVPVEVLPMDENGGLLLDRMMVRYSPSLEDPTRTDASSSPPGGYVGFAPVTFQGTNPSGQMENTTVVDLGSRLRSGAFGDLPSSEEEVDRCAEISGGRSFVRSTASRGEFTQTAHTAEVVHLATHAIADPIRPERSGILFFGPRIQGGALTDSARILLAQEIEQMHMEADLVVLSACETGLGRYRRGEGALSLARAFNYAGVRNVISSLWKVDDRATKEIMVKFYEKLAEGLGKADALAEAKRWYRKENPNAPPSHWAAFILIGDNEPVRLKKRSPVKPWAIGGGAIAVVVAAMAARRRRQRTSAT